jgi:hypothetical protein
MDLRAILILLILSPVLAFLFIIACGFTLKSTFDLQLSFVGLVETLLDNWVIVLLIFSELSTFLPTKWNGIVQYIVSALFRAADKRSNYFKNF